MLCCRSEFTLTTRNQRGRWIGLAALALLMTTGPAGSPRPHGAVGDAAWSQRAVGQVDGRARPGPIDAAVAAYRSALSADPANLEARWKLLRALHFAGRFSQAKETDGKRIWEEAIQLADESVDHVAEAVGTRFEELSGAEQETLVVVRGLPGEHVARLFFWSGVVWSRWSQQVGVLNAVRKGVAGRVRDYARTALQLEPGYRHGGPYRLLGRFHAVVPRVPFVTGWADRSRALLLLEQAYALAPWHPRNRLLLALSLEDLAPERDAQAETLLREVAQLTPREAEQIEDLYLRERARQRLAERP
jgi:tetratricopeptide (TPR) repeat protein